MDNSELLKKDKQIAKLQGIITDLNNSLKKSESLKSNFISNIMNEVYNPFSSIVSMADNIISLRKDNLEKAIPMAEIIYREAAQLDFHLQNIFTAASIEAGFESIETTNVNLNSVYESVTSKFKFDLSNKEIKVTSNTTADDDITFATDPKKISLILQNLLSNSIKYSPVGSEIIFHFEIIEGFLNISVQDYGQGMSEEDIDYIFNRFSRLDNTINSVTGGAGLGLSVVKALTELLNANIDVSSNNGTKVLITIPTITILDEDDMMSDEELF